MPLLPSDTPGKPRIILGLMTFGPSARVPSFDTFTKCLDHFQSRGYSEVDTARSYNDGKQEPYTASAKWQERGLTLATKCHPGSTPGKSHKPEDVRWSVETSLKELKADCVDILYLHAPDRDTPFEDTLRECDRLHKEGKLVRLGLSNFTAFEVAEFCMLARQHGWVRPTVAQYMYNAITRTIDPELITACRRYGLDIVVYNPLAGGFLSGKYTTKDMEAPPTTGRFSGANYRARYFKDANFAALSIIEPVVEKHGLTLLETALRWLRHHSALKMAPNGNDGIIIGVSSYEQLEGNLTNLEKGPLPQEVVDALDEAWQVAKGNTSVYWFRELKYGYDTEKALFGNVA